MIRQLVTTSHIINIISTVVSMVKREHKDSTHHMTNNNNRSIGPNIMANSSNPMAITHQLEVIQPKIKLRILRLNPLLILLTLVQTMIIHNITKTIISSITVELLVEHILEPRIQMLQPTTSITIKTSQDSMIIKTYRLRNRQMNLNRSQVNEKDKSN